MPIPKFTMHGLLPPYLAEATERDYSPYRTNAYELVQRFATNNGRIKLLQGFFLYRSQLRRAGVKSGFQWICGSFVEEVERLQGRAPLDIDLLNFLHIEQKTNKEILFDLLENGKANFGCDGRHIAFHLFAEYPEMWLENLFYWLGLFSHQRETSRWKGILWIDLEDPQEEDA